METLYDKYAKVLVNYSLGIKEGEKVVISSSYAAEPLLKAVYREAIRAGAHPIVQTKINGLERIRYEHSSDDQLEFVHPMREFMIDNYDAFLNIMAPFNLKSTQSINPKKKRMVAEAGRDIQKKFMKYAAENRIRWSLCQFPTDAAAQEANMGTEEFMDFVANACYLYHDDPVGKWNEVHENQQRIVDYLMKRETMHFKSADVDVKFSYKGRKWINSDGHNNMPSGEVFTTPVEDSIDGKIRFSYPGIFMGNEIEDITLEIEDGEVIKWKAEKGQELLDELFQIPGSRHFGEAAIGTNYGIKRFIKNMLFDEKIGGTIHMAVGAAYPDTGGTNECSIHWDLLADMKDGGEIYADSDLIYKDGEFII
ncbi:MAG: aminopeptidase [bacterium]